MKPPTLRNFDYLPLHWATLPLAERKPHLTNLYTPLAQNFSWNVNKYQPILRLNHHYRQNLGIKSGYFPDNLFLWNCQLSDLTGLLRTAYLYATEASKSDVKF